MKIDSEEESLCGAWLIGRNDRFVTRGGEISETVHDGRCGFDGIVNILASREAAETEANRGFGFILRQADGEKHRRRRYRAG